MLRPGLGPASVSELQLFEGPLKGSSTDWATATSATYHCSITNSCKQRQKSTIDLLKDEVAMNSVGSTSTNLEKFSSRDGGFRNRKRNRRKAFRRSNEKGKAALERFRRKFSDRFQGLGANFFAAADLQLFAKILRLALQTCFARKYCPEMIEFPGFCLLRKGNDSVL